MSEVVEDMLLLLPLHFGGVESWSAERRQELDDIIQQMQQDFETEVQSMVYDIDVVGKSRITLSKELKKLFVKAAGRLMAKWSKRIIKLANGVIFELDNLESQLKKLISSMRVAFEETVEEILKIYGFSEDCLQKFADVSQFNTVVDDVLREYGFNRAQIVAITVVTVSTFAVFLGFVLLGCSLFMNPSSMIPSLISSGMVFVSAFTMIR